MEKLLQAAAIAWNPAGEVRRRVDSGTLTVSAVLVPAIAAIIGCTLFKMAAWNFFWDSTFHAIAPQTPKMATSEFVVQLASAVGSLAPLAALLLLPERVFQPLGRSASGAAILIVIAANAFYAAAFGAIVYFVAGAQAWDNPRLGLRTFQLLSVPLAIGVTGLTLFFWCQIALSILRLRVGSFIGISVAAITALVALTGLIILLAHTSSAG